MYKLALALALGAAATAVDVTADVNPLFRT